MVYSGFATPKDLSVLGMDKYVSNVDKKPYQLLLYSSGLGFDSYNETAAEIDHRDAFHKAAIPATWANHGGSDVPLYAIGTLSGLLFSGTVDQTYVSHAIAFAMCIFRYQMRCMTYEYAHKPLDVSRDKKISSVHLVQQKLNREKFEQAEKDGLKNRDNVNNFAPKRTFDSFRQKLYSETTTSTTTESSDAFKRPESSEESFESSPDPLTEVLGAFQNATEAFNDTSYFDGAEIDVSVSSDLIGNFTETDSGGKKPSSLTILVLILVVVFRFVI